MNDAADTWALVVGINQYDSPILRRLQGAVADAVAAVHWLHKLGVPEDHIIAHMAPSCENDDTLIRSIAYKGLNARKETIDKSIAHLEGVKGARLFVFLCGHGLYEPHGERLFLTQEAGLDGVWMNLGLKRYFKLLQAMRFRRQFLIMDGCFNYPYSETRRPTIEAQGYPARLDPQPDRNNFFVACFAASEGEVAREVDGRGLFMNSFLTKVDPVHPWPDALDLDERDGSWSLDVRQVVLEGVKPLVKKVSPQQTPCVDPEGAALSEQKSVLYRIPSSRAGHIGDVIEDELVRLLVSVLARIEDPSVAGQIEKFRISAGGEVGAISWDRLAQDVLASEELEALMEVLQENYVEIEQWLKAKKRMLDLAARRRWAAAQSGSTHSTQGSTRFQASLSSTRDIDDGWSVRARRAITRPGRVPLTSVWWRSNDQVIGRQTLRLPPAWAYDTSMLIQSLTSCLARTSSDLDDDYARNSSVLAEVVNHQRGVQARLAYLGTWLTNNECDNKDDWLRDLSYAMQETDSILPRFRACYVKVMSEGPSKSVFRGALEDYCTCVEALIDSLDLVRDAIDPIR